ncbi:hypothetical protein V8G54_019842 [Vigna mungo]|uniref:Uncharacterized protein n=1 Tax=Vigna mungo TaxID=3915 RepID=A0AAQ3RW57_VIGMU
MSDIDKLFKVSILKRIRSFTEFNFFPLGSNRGTDRNPCLSSDTGKQVCPAKSSFPLSLSFTSIQSKASSGTLNSNLNSSSQTGYHVSVFTLVFFFTQSDGTPTMHTFV